MKSEIPTFLLDNQRRISPGKSGVALKTGFFDKGVRHFASLIKTTYVQWDAANRKGFLQGIDARVKVLFLILFIFIVSFKKTVAPQLSLCLFFFILVLLSRLNPFSFYGRVLFFGFFSGFLVTLPSSLNIITPGDMIVPLIHLSSPHQFWVYHIPETIGITRQGMAGVVQLTMRIINSLSLSFLIIHTTPFPEIMRALKSLRVPDPFLMIITLSYKYIFVFAKTLEDIHLARKGRTVDFKGTEGRQWIAGRMAFLLRKTQIRCEEVFQAMLARGFSGEVVFHACPKLNKGDLTAVSIFVVAAMVCLIM